MGRKNLYVADDDESTVERLERELERRGQSLSEFFMQAVKEAAPRGNRGRGDSTAVKVSAPSGITCAIAVDAAWRHSSAVTMCLGKPDSPNARAKDSSLIVAKVLRSDDPLGLWIELNSEQARFPTLPVLRYVVPWRFVFGVCVDPVHAPNGDSREKSYGLPSGDVTTIDAGNERN